MGDAMNGTCFMPNSGLTAWPTCRPRSLPMQSYSNHGRTAGIFQREQNILGGGHILN